MWKPRHLLASILKCFLTYVPGSRFPPPDEPDGPLLDLLDFDATDAVAFLTEASEHLVAQCTEPTEREFRLVQVHIAQAMRAHTQHRPKAEMRQWLYGLRIALNG